MNIYLSIHFFLILKMLRNILFVLLFLPLLYGCPNVNNTSKDAKELYANHMDFKKWEKVTSKGISFKIPACFEEEKYTNFTIDNYNSFKRSNLRLGLYFSVEVFSDTNAVLFQYMNNEKSLMYAVQKNYVNKIESGLMNRGSYRKSILKKITTKNKCFSQVISQNFVRQYKWDIDYSSSYFVATMKVRNQFYVFQLIGRSENQKYLYDDFLKILFSVK